MIAALPGQHFKTVLIFKNRIDTFQVSILKELRTIVMLVGQEYMRYKFGVR